MMKDIRKIAINYNYYSNKTSIKFDKKFLELPALYQLEVLEKSIQQLKEVANMHKMVLTNNFDLVFQSKNSTIN
tara:strand:+ start:3204 stop:3425 length:222 start_codon:yes stop_codon:yes gene_type:complete